MQPLADTSGTPSQSSRSPRRTLRAGLELTGLQLDATGSARYIRSLRRELGQRPRLELVELAHRDASAAVRRSRLVRGLSRDLLYFPLRLPREARRLSLDVLHCPVALAPPRSRIPLVVSVYDTLAWDHPHWLTVPNRLQQRLLLPRALRSSARVLTPSEFSRSRVLELFEIEAERVHVTSGGVDECFTPGPPADERLARLGVARPYLLTVGALQPRKNVEAAVRAFERLAADGAEHALVIVGGRGWSDEPLLRRVRSSPAAARIVLTGRVGDDDLVELYRGADCFVFPSRYEGFGLPPLEAMACGTPVVSSGRASLEEVVGEAALIVDPDDDEAIERAVAELISSGELRARLIARGRERAATFRWSRCADLTIEAYEQAAG
jgi:glycosyltransferase involved in cell wall biosynthesis